MSLNLDSRMSINRSWLLIWATTVAILGGLVFVTEAAWRSVGYNPSAVDSPALWQFWYDRAVSGGPRTIAMIGSSRIQAGISTQVLRDRLSDYRIVQLAKYASGGPIGVLRLLAADNRFNGIVICDTIEPYLLRDAWDEQDYLFDVNYGVRAKIEALAAARILENFAIRAKDTGVWAALGWLIGRGTVPTPRHIRMPADRSLLFDFSRVKGLQQFTDERNDDFRRRYEALQMPQPEGLDKDVAEIEGFVDRIQARGGQVVFLRMPSSGARLALEEEYHPKAAYWDRLATTTRGVWMHPADMGKDQHWESPDQSHLDFRDTISFTNALVDEILRKGVVTQR